MIQKKAMRQYLVRLGANIRTTRKTRKLTQRSVEEAAGWKSNVLSCYENGHDEPRLSTLLSIAAAMDVDVRELIPSSEEDK